MSVGSRHIASFKLFSTIASVVVFLTGVVVLAGWLFHVTVLKSFHAGLIVMKPNTAVCFVLLGVSLWLSQTKRAGPRSRLVAQVCALVAALVALANLLEYGLARNLGIDQLLFVDATEISTFSPPGRMTHMTAWILLLNGLGLLGLDLEGPCNTRPAQILALLAGACSILGMFGYIYGAFAFFGYTIAFLAMALPTALGSCLLSAGLLCARPDCGPMTILTSNNLGGTLARRLLLAAIMIPVALDVVTITAARKGFFGPSTHAVVDAMANVCIFAGLIFFTARLIDRLDAERRSREADLRVSEERFRAVAQTASDAIVTADQYGNIVLWNKAAETIFGYASSEILGCNVTTLMPERFQAAHKRGMEQAVAVGESKLAEHAIELMGRRKDGSELPVELSLAMWKNDEEILFTGVIRDITRRKTAEAERDRMIAELQKTLAEVKTLKGFIPICASCKKIRDDKGFWNQIESYISRHSDAKFSHGICPECTKKLYPEFANESEQSQSPAPPARNHS